MAATQRLLRVTLRSYCDEADVLEDIVVLVGLSGHSIGMSISMAWNEPLAATRLVRRWLFCVAAGGVAAFSRFKCRRLSFQAVAARMVGSEFGPDRPPVGDVSHGARPVRVPRLRPLAVRALVSATGAAELGTSAVSRGDCLADLD